MWRGGLCSSQIGSNLCIHRVYENPQNDGFLVDVPEEKLSDLILVGIHRWGRIFPKIQWIHNIFQLIQEVRNISKVGP